jgi:hypothetical protein
VDYECGHDDRPYHDAGSLGQAQEIETDAKLEDPRLRLDTLIRAVERLRSVDPATARHLLDVGAPCLASFPPTRMSRTRDTRAMKRNMLVLAFLASILPAQDKKKEVRQVKAIGCVRQGVEGGCLLLKTLDGETTYNIFADPKPEVGIVINIEGTDFRGVTACMEGIPITVTKWEATGETCKE